MSNTGRVWLITGASSGFGREIAQAALAAGDTVVATARRTAALDELATANPGRAFATTLDVTDQPGIDRAVAGVIEQHGRIDVLVNNAGHGMVGAAEETTDSELRELMEVHFFGPAALTRAVLPHMRRQGSGAIVQLTSQGGQLAFAGVSAYCATKFALEGYSEALAQEVGPLGIDVLIVEPGAFRTRLFAGGLRESAVIDAYDATVGPVRAMMSDGDGKQPGDPAKAAAAILTALDADPTPLRLPLGGDAVDALTAHADGVRAELSAWEKVSRDTAIED
ncbi:MAG TPA: oxidoreductase [Mycobacteriales bacterium]|jgi:NAD(P)-dependent dehydrogenase (short-subunit alcohol dehydrogenase family)|nr:oxidoreductase [Mycobacteriales bacterium]